MDNKKKFLDVLLNIMLTLGIICCAFLLILKIFFVKVIVSGSSMNPSITNGDVGYMVKVRQNTKIERFDVVAGEYNSTNDYYIIKRVLGLPGEHIKLTNNVLYVNDIVIAQNFSFNASDRDFDVNEWTLADDEYLLVGDNRAHTIAPVKEKKSGIIAKNGLSYGNYEIDSPNCKSEDYSSCPLNWNSWYKFKEGK